MSTAAAPHTYKRDQVERAIAITVGGQDDALGTPAPYLKADLKRLLDVDRKIGSGSGPQRAPYAFHDGPPPGKGHEIAFGLTDAFLLLVGVRLLQLGVDQSSAVLILRAGRESLRRELDRILRLGPRELRPGCSATELEAYARHGTLVLALERMCFFVINGGWEAGPLYDRGAAGEETLANICRTPGELHRMITLLSPQGQPVAIIELVNPAHRLRHWLGRVPTVRRGRP
jgi:hypothetical protein